MDLPKGSSATRWVQSFFWSSKSKEPNDALLAEKDRQLQDKDKELERTKNMLREKDELLKMNKHQHTLLVEKDKQLQNELKKMKEQLREKDEQLEIKDKLVEEGNKHIEHQEKPTMEKFDTLVTGKTLESHKTFVRQLIQGGATEVDSPDNSDVTIVFCPIVSSVQTNIAAALSNISGFNPVILVVMHHTFNPNYTVPNSSRVVNNSSVVLVVDCLFYESRGLFDCQRNKDAVSEVLKKLCPY
ncbi:uncharacterized protein [Centroberyx affinis]|uniref:uncharacterized protein isoform X2 n=1 Tax=Centroberyx affinis TaxID=166261 RepID=UPI003A5BE48F